MYISFIQYFEMKKQGLEIEFDQPNNFLSTEIIFWLTVPQCRDLNIFNYQ